MVVATNSSATHSIAELITEFHKTTGNVPPALIGASTTLANQHIYLFGGRLQTTRQISNLVYVLSLRTRIWKVIQPENTQPLPRYFHSANYSAIHNQIFIFGGMSTIKDENDRYKMTTLNDLISLNLKTMAWVYYPGFTNESNSLLPAPRYAHISSCIKDTLVIMGGQDIDNEYIKDINVYNIRKKSWYSSFPSQHQQYGVYRSAAVVVTPIELTPPFAPTMDLLSNGYEDSTQEVLKDVIYSHILVYSNLNKHNHTNEIESVDRKFHMWQLSYDPDLSVEMEDQSEDISFGNTSPSSFKFPSAFMCGQQLILAGPHFSPTSQQFQIWALDTTTSIWTKIEVGTAFSNGSWLRGLLNDNNNNNQFIVFGHPDRSMRDDYRDRVHCFEYIACVDIEIFGVYKPPRSTYSSFGQGLGLALLKDPILSDLKILSTDQQYIAVNSTVLAQRWPSIAPLIETILEPSSANGDMMHSLDFDKRELHFPDTYVVLIAFLQFIYTDHLVTAQQHQPQILARLLFIADLFEIPRLKALATHALHQMLNIQTATMIYESASLSNAVSLQIRALRVMINARNMMQRQKQMELKKRQLLEEQQQQQRQQQESFVVERPFSPPTTPLASNSSSLKLFLSQQQQQQQQQQHQTNSRLLQKYDAIHRQHNTIPTNMTSSLSSTENTRSHDITPQSSSLQNKHHRTRSERSLSIETSPYPATNISTINSSKSIKLPTFRMRQHTSSSHVNFITTTNNNDAEPKATASVSTTPFNNKSMTPSFWRQTSTSSNILSASLKKKNNGTTYNISPKLETKLNAFNFITSNHV
ncbi:uncharacterized protein BX663DRAFT_491389 [Cokeromyces recurvatus]|uniref:uncharacterized protein n=1 Tax=Cokeromyces recurvatus TaxID=90255 RepID=UPI00222007F1|nr:uncharacterized protein BX663DRAFT_491389 [Cokeromyces recurvatus]KAI7907589.1 hypothetical protein BX663DRAFT_491389 [Cokeromyces recurvatus]